MIVNGVLVGKARVTPNPPLASSVLYARSVRSRPPTVTSMLMSNSFASIDSLTSEITRSIMRSLEAGDSACRQTLMIRRQEIVIPVVEHALEQVNVIALRQFLEEIACDKG